MIEKRYVLDRDFSRMQVKAFEAGTEIDTTDLVVVKADPRLFTVKAGADLEGNDDPIPFVISTSDADRINDVIEQDGWDLDGFEANPVVLWCHNSWGHPLATSTMPVVKGDALEASVDFSETRDLNEFFSMTEKMIRRRVLRACSVGFQPKEHTWDDDQKGVHFYEQELFEWSICSIGMNRAALSKAKSAGISVAPMVAWLSKGLDERSPFLFIDTAEAEGIVKAFGVQRSYSLPEASMPGPTSSKSGTITKADAERLTDAISDLKDVCSQVKDVCDTMVDHVKSLGGHDKAFGKHDKAFGKHSDTISGHTDTLATHCDALGDHVGKIVDAIKAHGADEDDDDDDDSDEKSAALAFQIRRALKDHPEALKACEPILKGGAPHKLSSANLKSVKAAQKAHKEAGDHLDDVVKRHEAKKSDDDEARDEEDPEDTGDADKPDEKALADAQAQLDELERKNAVAESRLNSINARKGSTPTA